MSSVIAKRAEAGAVPTVDDLYRTIRAEILSGELVAGSVVSQVKLAQRLDVNRTPLREALRMLQREGLVDSEHNRRIRIAALSNDDLVQLYAQRIVQESLAIRLTVPHLTPAELKGLDDLLVEMDACAAPETLSEWETSHRQFHRQLIAKAGGRLASSADDLAAYCERYRRALLSQMPIGFAIGAREHAVIVEACHHRDPVAAGVALARHLGRTALTLVSVTDPTFDPKPVREALRLVTGDLPQPQPNVPDM